MLRHLSDIAETILVVDSNPMGLKLVEASPEKVPTHNPADGEA